MQLPIPSLACCVSLTWPTVVSSLHSSCLIMHVAMQCTPLCTYIYIYVCMADMLVTQCDAHDNCLLSPSSTDVCLGEPSFTPHSTTCSQQELRLYCRSLHHCPHVSCICQHDVACYRLLHMLAQAGLHSSCLFSYCSSFVFGAWKDQQSYRS